MGNAGNDDARTAGHKSGVGGGQSGSHRKCVCPLFVPEALSQYNGSAIFIRSNLWQPYGPLGVFPGLYYQGGLPSSYALGTLMHEILHKQAIDGGFTHNQIDSALEAMGAYIRPAGTNGDSASLANICF